MGTNVLSVSKQNRTLTPDGRYFPDHLLKTVRSGKVMVSKENFFRFARDNGFARDAEFYFYSKGIKLEHYIEAVRRLIQSRARFGFKLDEKSSSQSNNIVFERVKEEGFEIETHEATRQAKQVLGIAEIRR